MTFAVRSVIFSSSIQGKMNVGEVVLTVLIHLWIMKEFCICDMSKGWLAIIAKLKPLSLFISLLLMLKKAFDNVKIEK